ncbi:MAG TPA: hypothetical protein VFZ11_15435 [Gemmatimonadaceae bacterium]
MRVAGREALFFGVFPDAPAALFDAGRLVVALFTPFPPPFSADTDAAGRGALFFAGSAFGRAGSAARGGFGAGGAGAEAPAAAGVLFGRPLRRAALPAASIASNAAFASAISCEWGEVRSRCARSFSAR